MWKEGEWAFGVKMSFLEGRKRERMWKEGVGFWCKDVIP